MPERRLTYAALRTEPLTGGADKRHQGKHACKMPRHPDVPDRLHKVPFRGSIAVARGELSRTQLESGCWRRLVPDVYVHADVQLTYAMRCRAVGLILPAGAAISGVSAAHLHGVDVLNSNDGIEVTVPSHVRMRARPGVVVRSGRLDPNDVDLTIAEALHSPRLFAQPSMWRVSGSPFAKG